MKKLTLSLASIVALSTLSFAGGDIEEPVVVATPEVVAAPEAKSDIEISANMTMATKYVWRGVDQNNQNPAIQGGIDVAYKGFYIGTWASNVATGSDDVTIELDIYAGYAGEVAGIGFDIGAIAYLFPGDGAEEFDDVAKEVYLGISKEFGDFGLGAKVYYDPDLVNEDNDEGTFTAELSASYKTLYDIALDGTVGMNNALGNEDDYYYSLGVSKEMGKFTVGVTYHGYYSDALDDTTDNIVGYVTASF